MFLKGWTIWMKSDIRCFFELKDSNPSDIMLVMQCTQISRVKYKDSKEKATDWVCWQNYRDRKFRNHRCEGARRLWCRRFLRIALQRRRELTRRQAPVCDALIPFSYPHSLRRRSSHAEFAVHHRERWIQRVSRKCRLRCTRISRKMQ